MRKHLFVSIISLAFYLISTLSFSQAPAIEWQQSFGGSADDKALSAIQTIDGGYIIAGSTESNDGDVNDNVKKLNCWVVKLNGKAELEWKKCFGGESAHQANEIIQCRDRCYVIAGSTMLKDGNETGVHGSDDYWIYKINTSQVQQWSRSYGGKSDDNAKSIQQTSDGGYIVAGWGGINGNNIKGNLGGNDFWIVKLNPPPLEIAQQKITQNISVYPNPSHGSFMVNVPVDAKYIEISNSLGQELEKRLAYVIKHPEAGKSWDEVKNDLTT